MRVITRVKKKMRVISRMNNLCRFATLASGDNMPKRYPTTQEKRDVILARLKRSMAGIGDETLFPFVPNPMLAGPCEAASRLAGKSFIGTEAPLPPFDDCPHPDQCGCGYGAGRPSWLGD